MYDFDKINYDLRLNKYRRISSGSSRIVFDLNDGNVVKVAKNDKGFDQNQTEYHLFTPEFNILNARMAEVIDASSNYRFIVMERAEKSIRGAKQLRTALGCATEQELYNKLIGFATDYDLIIWDLLKPSSWGKIDNIPVLIDYGLTGTVYDTHYSFSNKLRQRRAI